MTTLNTIIEEEKKEFETVFGDNLGLDEPFNNSYLILHVKPRLKTFLTTAMQRAYEAGLHSQQESLLREVEGMKYRFFDGFGEQADSAVEISTGALRYVGEHAKSVTEIRNNALDAVIEKIKPHQLSQTEI